MDRGLDFDSFHRDAFRFFDREPPFTFFPRFVPKAVMIVSGYSPSDLCLFDGGLYSACADSMRVGVEFGRGWVETAAFDIRNLKTNTFLHYGATSSVERK